MAKKAIKSGNQGMKIKVLKMHIDWQAAIKCKALKNAQWTKTWFIQVKKTPGTGQGTKVVGVANPIQVQCDQMNMAVYFWTLEKVIFYKVPTKTRQCLSDQVVEKNGFCRIGFFTAF